MQRFARHLQQLQVSTQGGIDHITHNPEVVFQQQGNIDAGQEIAGLVEHTAVQVHLHHVAGQSDTALGQLLMLEDSLVHDHPAGKVQFGAGHGQLQLLRDQHLGIGRDQQFLPLARDPHLQAPVRPAEQLAADIQ